MHVFDDWDGALLVDKPPGPTSHDVVDDIRRHFGFAKVGHCGTLDPAATGLLMIVLGRGTKLSEKLMGMDKVYEGTQGEVERTEPVPPLTLDQLNEAAAKFVGDLMQVPPMVSAVKVKGVPLYKLARKGLEVERQSRLVHVYHFRFTRFADGAGDFRMACTKGTYVRSIAHDLGQALGCGAHLSALRRLESGRFKVDGALPLDRILRLTRDELKPHILPFLKLVTD
jgi:tRNA pseudouridine55 synthase